MKTSKILTIAILSIVFMQFSNAAIPVLGRVYDNSSLSGNMVKAIFVDGAYMPVVDLPEVEIISTKTGPSILKGVIDNGQVIAIVELPAVEISVSRLSSDFKNNIDNFEAIYDIPVIEIEGTYPSSHFVKGTISQNTGMAVVDLPEITVVVDKNSGSDWMAFVSNQEEFHTNSNKLNESFAPSIKLILDGLAQENTQLANISLNLQNCALQNDNTIVCEFISETSSYATGKIKNGLLKLIFSK